jgi:hypothetical protein
VSLGEEPVEQDLVTAERRQPGEPHSRVRCGERRERRDEHADLLVDPGVPVQRENPARRSRGVRP